MLRGRVLHSQNADSLLQPCSGQLAGIASTAKIESNRLMTVSFSSAYKSL